VVGREVRREGETCACIVGMLVIRTTKTAEKGQGRKERLVIDGCPEGQG
jgi:hypothetical protein